MKSIVVGLLLVSFLLGTLGLAQAAEGTVGCSLYYASRLDGAEITYTNISFRNLASKGTITIEKVDIYQSDGTLAAGLASGKYPSGFRGSLGPRQYTSLRLTDVLKAPPAVPGLQAIVSWTTDSAGVSPMVTSVFLTFGR
ncbi:MAG TPA: hypothetical protein VFF86_03955, partial [Candidatus Methylomirabilis sp.]|nr:hypothetical protein [Candidatus Methylomirabilis sp.]